MYWKETYRRRASSAQPGKQRHRGTFVDPPSLFSVRSSQHKMIRNVGVK